MSSSTKWDETVQAILIGASRAKTTSTELLERCAALGLAAHAAPIPPVIDTLLLSPANQANFTEELEFDQAANMAAQAVLAQIIALNDQVLLTEWCGLASNAGVCAESRQLPVLLGLGTEHSTLRPAIASVLGERGQWLAGIRPGWAWATITAAPTNPVELAEVLNLSGNRRLSALQRARAVDPAGTRDFLAEQFGLQRRAADRQALISALETALNPDDEPLLEHALDDRATGVHDEAIRLLRALRTSQLADRAEQRLDRGLHLTAEGFDVRSGELWTDPERSPAEARDLLSDGSEARIAGRIKGAASVVSPQYWTDRLNTDDAGAARELERGPWATELFKGISQRLTFAKDPRPWAMAASRVLADADQITMLAALPPDLASQILVAISQQWSYNLFDHACSQLASPWPAQTTAVLLNRYAEMNEPQWRAGRPPAVLLARGDVEVLNTQLNQITKRWPEHTTELDTLRLRITMRDAFSPNRKERQ